MALTYLGTRTLAETFPGVVAILDRANAALDDVRQAVAKATLALSVQVTALDAATITVRAAALVDLEAQLGAVTQLTASLQASVTDPSTYLAGLVTGLVQVQANLGQLLPSVALAGQLSAGLGAGAQLRAKIAAFDLVLTVFSDISRAIGTIVIALSTRLDVTLPRLPTAAGLSLYLYDGPVANFGAELQTALNANPDFVPAVDGSAGAAGNAASHVLLHAPVLVGNAANGTLGASLDLFFGLRA